MTSQNYEDYWKLTLEYSDINSDKFLGTLSIIVNFIDKNSSEEYSKEKYDRLQQEVFDTFPKEDMGSVRKSINQFIKLGFINFELRSYHPNTKDFINAKTKRKRQSIFSRIVYTNSSFSRSVTNDSNGREINFLIKTLEENGKLHKRDIISLMTVDVSEIASGYLNSQELSDRRVYAEEIDFIERKYNQVSYLWGVLGKLDDLIIIDDYLYFQEDAQVILDSEIKKDKLRDPYLHRIYKNQLKEESTEILGGIKCMVEKLVYPTLVASHIKPFVKSSEEESYDPENGLLLSQNMDGLFDNGYISFNDDGSIILSDKLDPELRDYLSKYVLDGVFVGAKRKEYLNYHIEIFGERLGI